MANLIVMTTELYKLSNGPQIGTFISILNEAIIMSNEVQFLSPQ